MTARKPLVFELAIVFALSLGASAIYSVVALIAKLLAPAGLAGQVTKINGSMARAEWLDLTYQLLSLTLGLAPVALALYLIWQTNKNPFAAVGLNLAKPAFWLSRGIPARNLYRCSRSCPLYRCTPLGAFLQNCAGRVAGLLVGRAGAASGSSKGGAG